MHMPDDYASWQRQLPVPVFDEEPGYLELYRTAWELARQHRLDLPGMPVTPYMDEGFCDTDIWIWDSCFMSLFCKYAPSEFPGVETLENFYRVLYGGARLPVITSWNAPKWACPAPGTRQEMVVHIADNPPLFAWAEYENALFTGDLGRVRRVLKKEYLQKHWHWLESLTAAEVPPGVRCKTCWVSHPEGYFWEGGRSGMDNTPRGRLGASAPMERPNNPVMYWLDAIVQQGLAALSIARLAALTGDAALESEWLARYEAKKEIVNRLYWDPADGCYYDVDSITRRPIRVLTPASFWPLTAGMADAAQTEAMLKIIESPEKLGGEYPWVSLSRDDADFNPADGHYWRGAVWLPTAYAGLRGLAKYGKFETANATARRLVGQMYRTWCNYEPHTIWECYSPNSCEPARSCDESNRIVRPDFCGWSALGPISIFLEFVIGLHKVDAFRKEVHWALPAEIKGKLGVRNLSFGGIHLDLIYENGVIEAVSTGSCRLLLADGRAFAIHPGKQEFTL